MYYKIKYSSRNKKAAQMSCFFILENISIVLVKE